MRLRHAALACAVVSLGAAVALQSGALRGRRSVAAAPDLAALLPRNLAGWQATDLPLGATEGEDADVRRTLGFDAVCYREYTSSGRRLAVFVAHWGRHRLSPTVVGVHVPDICWTCAGWTCERARALWTLPGADATVWPAHYRQFSAEGRAPRHVVFWHLLGGRPFYGDTSLDGSRSVREYARGALLHLAGRDPEQLFVRVDSDRPFEELAGDPGFRALLASLAHLGLARN